MTSRKGIDWSRPLLGAAASIALLLSISAAMLSARPDGFDISAEGSVVAGGMFCAESGCHDLFNSGNTFNDLARISLIGLPESYEAGETIDFDLEIEGPPSARVFGFQMMAVFNDEPTRSAGRILPLIFEADSFEIEGISVATHTPRPLDDNRVRIRWIAPEGAGGTVLFRVAANAANGNSDPSGDHIAVLESLVAQVGLPDPPDEPPKIETFFPQVGDGLAGDIRFRTTIILANTGESSTAELEFLRFDGDSGQALPMEVELGSLGRGAAFQVRLERGESFSAQTAGSEALQVGYARLRAASGVGGTAVFTRNDRESGALVFETGVPASATLTDFSLFVDRSPGRNTGLALVNPGDQSSSVVMRVYDKSFVQQGASLAIPLAPGEHLPRFVNEIFLGLALEEGILTVDSEAPLAAVTLRDNEGLLAAFPVIEGRPEQIGGSFSQQADGSVRAELALSQMPAPSGLLFRFYSEGRFVGLRAFDSLGKGEWRGSLARYPDRRIQAASVQAIDSEGRLGPILMLTPGKP